MDTSRFDRLTMTFGQEPSRRDLLRLIGAAALTVGGLTLLESDDSEAKERRKKRKKKSSCQGKCGGKCPHCSAGKSCDNRGDCTTALCKDGVCTEPVDATECGLDTDGNTCFTRDSVESEKYCSRQLCRFFATGTCEDHCTGEENCSNAGGGIECCLPCGSPLD